MKDKSTLSRLTISIILEIVTEMVLQIIQVVFSQHVSFGMKEQQKVIKVSFQ